MPCHYITTTIYQKKIAQGYEGIQYLEYKNLADILLEKINKSSS